MGLERAKTDYSNNTADGGLTEGHTPFLELSMSAHLIPVGGWRVSLRPHRGIK